MDPSGLDDCAAPCFNVTGTAYSAFIGFIGTGSYAGPFHMTTKEWDDVHPLTGFPAAKRNIAEARKLISRQSFSSECDALLAKLGITGQQLKDAVSSSEVLDGDRSTQVFSSLVALAPGEVYDAYRSDFGFQTVTEFFSKNAEVQAVGEFKGHQIFIRSSWWQDLDVTFAAEILAHEVLHNLGLFDGSIVSRLYGDSAAGRTALEATLLVGSKCIKQ
jgi:hypothetical protein